MNKPTKPLPAMTKRELRREIAITLAGLQGALRCVESWYDPRVVPDYENPAVVAGLASAQELFDAWHERHLAAVAEERRRYVSAV